MPGAFGSSDKYMYSSRVRAPGGGELAIDRSLIGRTTGWISRRKGGDQEFRWDAPCLRPCYAITSITAIAHVTLASARRLHKSGSGHILLAPSLHHRAVQCQKDRRRAPHPRRPRSSRDERRSERIIFMSRTAGPSITRRVAPPPTRRMVDAPSWSTRRSSAIPSDGAPGLVSREAACGS